MTAPLPPQIYLGSKSIGRRRMLEELGVTPICVPSHIDESVVNDSDSEQLVQKITALKTDAVVELLKTLPDLEADFLVCGDIVCTSKDGTALGQPKSAEEARRWLEMYSRDREAGSVQAIEVVNLRTGKRLIGTDKTKIYFNKDINQEMADEFLTNTIAMKAAGAMLIEHPMFTDSLDRIEGDIDSVIGLSKKLFLSLIEEAASSSHDQV